MTINEQEQLINALNTLRRLTLDKKPHIREYYKARKIHQDIVDAMVQYFQDGKFEYKQEPDFIPGPRRGKTDSKVDSEFDLSTREGAQGFYDLVIYKTSPGMICMTEGFIRNHRFKKPEKIELLQSMLHSNVGLFEVTRTDMDEGYAYLKDVFTGDEYTLTDIALSGVPNYEDFFIYTRIIRYHDISFGTGLCLTFTKTDRFIRDHIQHYKENFDLNEEFIRFTQLYNRYSKSSKRVAVVGNRLK